MAESSLSLGYPELRSAIGYYLGYGITSGNWSTAQIAEIQMCLDSGLRQFYDPPPLQPGGSRYEWLFMKPVTTLSTAVGVSTVTLPDSYGGLDGELTYASGVQIFPIRVVGEDEVRKAQQQTSNSSGPPYMCCVRPVSADGITTGQRYQAEFFPTPDQIYVLTYKRNFLANNISATYPYPWGGEVHAETIQASCIAAAERIVDDVSNGPKWQYFMERLGSSIESDRRNGRQYFGKNDDKDLKRPVRPVAAQQVLYNGANIN